MKIGVFSDIHANIQACDAVLNLFQQEGVKQIRYLGDLVGYGGSPVDVFYRLIELEDAGILKRVKGNHDEAMREDDSLEGSNKLAQVTLLEHRKMFEQSQRDRLLAAPYTLDEKFNNIEIKCSHGAYNNAKEFYYVRTQEDAELELASIPNTGSILCQGHSHMPLIVQYAAQLYLPQMDFRGKDHIEFPIEGKNLVNVGSAGQPRDNRGAAPNIVGDPRATCVIIDTQALTITYHKVPYDIDGAVAAMQKLNLSEKDRRQTTIVMRDRLKRGV